jgi:2-polyprenyl-6-methoxyphenol hydroxylase-like FAD-dependent oxidoreductase
MRIAVIGGGVGGLTAAIALRRRGFEVDVLEQAPAPAAVGASLQLGPNAVRLLAEMGLLPALRTIGVRPDAVDLLRWDDGSLLLHQALGEEAEAHFGAPQLDFYRPDLHRVLADALPDGVLRFGVRVEGIEQDESGVTVVAEHGERIRADAAVAADGIRSQIRRQMIGEDKPTFSNTVVYRGVAARADVADLHPDRLNLYWLGPHRHGVSYWIAGARLLAVNCAVQDAEWSQESWTLEAPPEEAARAFAGWHAPLLERIMRVTTTLRGAVFVRQPIDHWSFGRVTLLGDAAHAMEPFQAQGAAQAVEDAYVLAECLAADADPVQALERYERIRMGRAEELQESSAAAAELFYLADGDEQRRRDARYATILEELPFGTRQPIWEYDVREALASTV